MNTAQFLPASRVVSVDPPRLDNAAMSNPSVLLFMNLATSTADPLRSKRIVTTLDVESHDVVHVQA